MNNFAEMTVEELKERLDRLESTKFFENMSERPNKSVLDTISIEIRAVRKKIEELGGRWSE